MLLFVHNCLPVFVRIVLELNGRPFKETSPRHSVLAKLELTSLSVLWLTMWCGIMIFSSSKDQNFVQFLIVMVALMTTFMMVWLVGQLIRECLHEKKAGAVEAVESIMKIKKRISAGLRGVRLATNEDADEGDGTGVSEIELRPHTWSQPNNPAMNIDKSNSKGFAFMAAPPPAPTKKNTSEQSEQIRKDRLTSLNARRRSKEKGQGTRDVRSL